MPAAIAGGVLIDADHLLDQVWYFYLHKRPAAILVLHAWEWLAVLVAASAWLSFPPLLMAATVGYAGHLATDQRFNSVHKMGYFFSYRARHGFDPDRLTTEWRLDPPFESFIKELGVIRRPWR